VSITLKRMIGCMIKLGSICAYVKNKRREDCRLQVFITLIALVGLAFHGALKNDFAYDDVWRIGHGIRVLSVSGWLDSLLTGMPPGDLFRPVFEFSILANRVLFGLEPAAFHLVDLMIHATNCCLLYVFFVPIVGIVIAFWASAFFAVHPVLTETVANVSGRAETLTLFFGMLSLLFGRKYLCGGTYWFCFGWIVAIILAALTKESGLVFFPLLLLSWWYLLPLGQIQKGRFLKICCTFGIILFVLMFIRVLVLGNYAFGGPVQVLDNPLVQLDWWPRMLNALILLGRYISIVFIPITLIPECAFDPCRLRFLPLNSTDLLVVTGVVGLFIIGAYSVSRRWSTGFGIFWFFIMFATTANIFSKIGTMFGERLVYGPSYGLIIVSLILVHSIIPYRTRMLLLFILIVSAVLRTWIQVPVWRSSVSVFESVVAHGPRSPRAVWDNGFIALMKGDYRAAQSLLYRAHRKFPNFHNLTADLGLSALMNHRSGLARRYFRRSGGVSYQKDPKASVGMALFLIHRGQHEKAKKLLEGAIKQSPTAFEPRLILLDILYKTGNFEALHLNCLWFASRNLTPCWDIYRFLRPYALAFPQYCKAEVRPACSVRE